MYICVNVLLVMVFAIDKISDSSCHPTRRNSIEQNRTPEHQNIHPMSKHGVHCYRKLCTCRGTVATCYNTSLSYIPRLWKNITELIFSHNNLHHVTERTFSNLTSLHLVNLSLTWNNITNISSGAFSVFRHLELLDLSGNRISPDDLRIGLQGLLNSPLRKLMLKNMTLHKLPRDVFHGMNGRYIEVIDLGFNSIREFDQKVFSTLPLLHELKMYKNSIHEMKWGYSTSMKSFEFNSNSYVNTIPSFCNASGAPFYPNLEQLFLNELGLVVLTAANFTCLPSLKLVALSDNPVKVIHRNTFSSLPNLQTVLVQHIKDGVVFAKEAFNNPNLQTLRMSTNSKWVDIGVFDGCHGLTYMDLSGNHFSYINDSMMTRIFKDIHGLTRLNMGHCSLQYFPSVIYIYLHSLEQLIISSNNIQGLPSRLFQNLTHMTKFDAALNQLSGDKEEPFTESVMHQLQDVALGGNPLVCTCNTRWLMQWLRREPKKFRGYPHSYVCNSPPEHSGQELIQLYISEQPCLLQRNTYVIFIAALIVVVLAIVVYSVVYKWRWHLRYIVFLLKHQGHHRRPPANQFTFDAFVVYSPSDTPWVTNHLLPCLEEEKGLTLCIHERDFDVGGDIGENIVDNVEASRKVLIVLSCNSLQNDWCQFEISFAHSRSLRANPGSLVVILKDGLNNQFMTKSIRVLLDVNGYSTWPGEAEDTEVRRLFWEEVVAKMH